MPSPFDKFADIQELRRPFPTNAGDLGLTVLTYQGILLQTGKPTRFYVKRGRRHPPVKGEPTGIYLLFSEPDEKKEAIANLERPLVIDHGGPQRSGRWEERLKNFFGGKRGPRITKGLQKKLRYDGIITIWKGKPRQIVVFGSSSLSAPVSPKELQRRKAAKDLEKYFPFDARLISAKWGPDTRKWLKEIDLTEEHTIMRLSGVSGLYGPADLTIDLDDIGLIMTVQGRRGTVMKRSIRLEDGKPYLYNDYLAVEENAPENLWLKIFYSQILTSMKLMFDKIECYATRESRKDGYRHWPLLGYNATFKQIFRDTPRVELFVEELKKDGALKPGISPDIASVTDLMRTKKGRDWWSKKGLSFYPSFNLNPVGVGRSSKSVQVLESYLDKKAQLETLQRSEWLTKHGMIHSDLRKRTIRLAYQKPELRPYLLPLLRRAQKGTNLTEQIPLTPEDENLLGIIWDGLDEQWETEEKHQ